MAFFNLPSSPGFGALLGTGIGEGLERGAQRAQDLKVDAQRKNVVAKGLEALGINPEHAAKLAGLPEKVLPSAIDDFLVRARAQQGVQSPLAKELAALGLGSSPQEAAAAQALQQSVQPQGAQGAPGLPQQQPQGKSFADILAQPYLSDAQRLQVAKLQQAEHHESNKETLPFYRETLKKGKAANDTLLRLGRQEELIKKGNLTGPGLNAAIDTLAHGIFGLGIDLSGLTSADTQEFRKLENEYLRLAKDYFGGRVTNFEAKQFLRTVPSLLQSDEGKLRIIDNLRIFANIDKARADATQAIVDANGGNRPRSLEAQVEKAIEPLLEQYSRQIKRESGGLVEKLPPASEAKGATATDEKTGKRYRSDGVSWKEI